MLVRREPLPQLRQLHPTSLRKVGGGGGGGNGEDAASRLRSCVPFSRAPVPDCCQKLSFSGDNSWRVAFSARRASSTTSSHRVRCLVPWTFLLALAPPAPLWRPGLHIEQRTTSLSPPALRLKLVRPQPASRSIPGRLLCTTLPRLPLRIAKPRVSVTSQSSKGCGQNKKVSSTGSSGSSMCTDFPHWSLRLAKPRAPLTSQSSNESGQASPTESSRGSMPTLT
mmetsp:Transcript_93742/g.201241  ORF Transcript_93742/g.201241 Transcript_93742/m.201241 type:complete len:224 (+) Transcript_93742:179-850(+)